MFENFEMVEVLCWCYEGVLEEILWSGVIEGVFVIVDMKVVIMGIIVMLIGLNMWFCEDGWFSFEEVEDFYWGMVCNLVGLVG